MRERAAHSKRLGPRLEPNLCAARQIARRRRDGGQVNYSAAVDLPEAIGIELSNEFLERGADQRFALGGEYAGVLIICLEVTDFVD